MFRVSRIQGLRQVFPYIRNHYQYYLGGSFSINIGILGPQTPILLIKALILRTGWNLDEEILTNGNLPDCCVGDRHCELLSFDVSWTSTLNPTP